MKKKIILSIIFIVLVAQLFVDGCLFVVEQTQSTINSYADSEIQSQVGINNPFDNTKVVTTEEQYITGDR